MSVMIPAYTRARRLTWIILNVLLVALMFMAVPAYSQDYRAKLTVTVTDSTGAIVPDASLQLVRTSTGQTTTATTDATGSHTFLFLEPDSYSVRATAPTMNPEEVKGIVMQSYGATSVNIRMKPATATTEVTVTSEGAVLQTESASRAWNINHDRIKELPIPNNNPVMLGNDLPGVYMRPRGVYTDPWTVTSQFLINGGLMYLNEFQIDGSPNDAELGSNTYAYTPPAYAVKEFTVSANNYDAQYGHTSGGVINLTTLSGTSDFHGMGWMSLRRTGWNANLYQNKYQNAIHGNNNAKRPFNS